MKLNFRSPALVFSGVFIAALFGCAVGCTIALQFFKGQSEESGRDPHDWLHEQLGITAEQKEELEAMEERFEVHETELRAIIASGNVKLGKAINEDQENTPRVRAIVKEIHQGQAALQNATIDHLMEMKRVLTEPQFRKLLELSGEALSDF